MEILKRRKRIRIIVLIVLSLITPYIVYFSTDASKIPREEKVVVLKENVNGFTNFILSSSFFVHSPEKRVLGDDLMIGVPFIFFLFFVGAWVVGSLMTSFQVVHDENEEPKDKFFLFPFHYIAFTLICILFPIIIAVVINLLVPFPLIRLLYYIAIIIILIKSAKDDHSLFRLSHAFIDFIKMKAGNKQVIIKYKEEYKEFMSSQNRLMKKYSTYE